MEYFYNVLLTFKYRNWILPPPCSLSGQEKAFAHGERWYCFSCRVNRVPFEGLGAVVHCASVFFNPSAIVSLTAGLCVCVWFPFWTEPCLMPSAQWPVPSVWGAWHWPFVCPHKTSLPAWQNTGLRLRLKLRPLRNWEWERLEAGAGGGVRWQFLMHCWFLTDHKSNC